jgi:hypothetical protein
MDEKNGRKFCLFIIIILATIPVRCNESHFFLESPRTATRLRVCLVYNHNLSRHKLVMPYFFYVVVWFTVINMMCHTLLALFSHIIVSFSCHTLPQVWLLFCSPYYDHVWLGLCMPTMQCVRGVSRSTKKQDSSSNPMARGLMRGESHHNHDMFA